MTRYLREIKEVAKLRGMGALGCTHLKDSEGRAEVPQDLGWEKRGWGSF